MNTPIKLNDLRIGNLLNYQTEEGIQPSAMDWQDLKWLTEDPEDFNAKHSGIALNEEWILKFGFEANKHADLSDSFWYHKLGGSGFYINYENGVVWIIRGENIFNLPCLIENIHQLQNLFYALTGEELQG
jgi:hypothetical protein